MIWCDGGHQLSLAAPRCLSISINDGTRSLSDPNPVSCSGRNDACEGKTWAQFWAQRISTLCKMMNLNEIMLVPGGGVEPPWPQGPADFESAASASSAIPARGRSGRAAHKFPIALYIASDRLSTGPALSGIAPDVCAMCYGSWPDAETSVSGTVVNFRKPGAKGASKMD